MNFSAFGGFSGIHQFAAKFGHDAQSGAFTSAAAASNMSQDIHGQRYHTTAATNANHFNQNTTSRKCAADAVGRRIDRVRFRCWWFFGGSRPGSGLGMQIWLFRVRCVRMCVCTRVCVCLGVCVSEC